MRNTNVVVNERIRQSGSLLMAMAVCGGLVTTEAFAQEEASAEVASPLPTTAPVENLPTEPAKAQSKDATVSPGIADVLKMAEAGVSMTVIKAFVEKSSVPFDPSAEDLIALKERAVSDDVTAALLKRGAKVRSEIVENTESVAVPTVVRDLSTGGQLDPESYDFWYYHYAYPRALSYSYRTLAPYWPQYYPNYYTPYGGAHLNGIRNRSSRSQFNSVRGSGSFLSQKRVGQSHRSFSGRAIGPGRR